jgi:hypothetical protein
MYLVAACTENVVRDTSSPFSVLRDHRSGATAPVTLNVASALSVYGIMRSAGDLRTTHFVDA